MPSITYQNGQNSYAGEDLQPGDVVCIKVAEPYVYYKATTANLVLADGYWVGVVLAPATQGSPVAIQSESFCPTSVTGLGAGASGDVYITADGRITRTVVTEVIGICNTLGDVFIGRIGSAASGITIAPGAADTVLRMNGAGTLAAFAKVLNINVAPAAAIAGSKVVSQFGAQNVSTLNYTELQYQESVNPTTGSFATVGLWRERAQDTEWRTPNTTPISYGGPFSGYWNIGGYYDASISPRARMSGQTAVRFTSPVTRFRDLVTYENVFQFAVVPAGATEFLWADSTSTPSFTQTTTGSATGARFSVVAGEGATTGADLVLATGLNGSALRSKINLVGQLGGYEAGSAPMRWLRNTATFPSGANYTLVGDGTFSPELVVTSAVGLASTVDLILPLLEGGFYSITNSTTGAQSIRAIGASGTGVTIPNGDTYFVYCDGANYIRLTGGGPQGPTGATGAAGSAGSPGANGDGWVVDSFTSSGSLSVPANCSRVDAWVLPAGGGGAGGGGGGGSAPEVAGGGGGGGGGSGYSSTWVFVPLINVTGGGTIGATVGAAGTAGIGGGGGAGAPDPIPPGSGSPGTAGGAGGASGVTSLFSIAGGAAGSAGGGGGGASHPSSSGSGGAGGAGQVAGGTGSNGSSGGVASSGASTTGITASSVKIQTPYGRSSGSYAGSLTGAGNGTGSPSDGTYTGKGGAGAPCTQVIWHPWQAAPVVAASPGNGNGNDATGTPNYGLGGAGGGGGNNTGSGAENGNPGGDGTAGGAGLVLFNFYTRTSEVP